ncbi:MAG TPA: hypothetical protein VLM37_05760 [Fibrobacteraceae bacterium]|nr:hypothetical protein [Fibrobacteraceae bacterium]
MRRIILITTYITLAVSIWAVPMDSIDGLWSPLAHPAFTTSSFGENRGTRYHNGVDWSTDKQEGWPVVAPENGHVERLRQSPYGYGRNLLYRGISGRIWVFGHLSGFAPRLDSAFEALKEARQTNDLNWDSIPDSLSIFQRNDTLAFSGSTGIGSPHLHMEVRDSTGRIVFPPCQLGTLCMDTIAPQILGAAVWDATNPQGHVVLTSRAALAQGCLEVDTSFFNPRWALKIVDYSREPKENPMSIYTVHVKQGEKTLFAKSYPRLPVANAPRIREELLWSEESDTAGDWHYMGMGWDANSSIGVWDAVAMAKALRSTTRKSTLETRIEDQSGHITQLDLVPQTHCAADPVPILPHPLFQDSLLFTFLVRPWIDLGQCAQSRFQVQDSLGKMLSDSVCAKLPHQTMPLQSILVQWPKARLLLVTTPTETRRIHLHPLPAAGGRKPIEWATDGVSMRLRIWGGLFPNVLAWEKRDSVLDSIPGSAPTWVFHPKGLHLRGNWEVCLDLPDTVSGSPRLPITRLDDSTAHTLPRLYWLGETTRRWFSFSRQRVEWTDKTQRRAHACTSVDELRDLAFQVDTLAPILGDLRDTVGILIGKTEPVWRIHLTENWSGIPNGNAVQVRQKGRWIPVEFDSDPLDIVVDPARLTPGIPWTLRVRDEAGNVAERKYPGPVNTQKKAP